MTINRRFLQWSFLSSMILLVLAGIGFGQNESPTGTISGTLLDRETKMALPGGNVVLMNTTLGASADLDGHFTILDVPVGNYTVQFSFIGYETVSKTDVIVRPKRITTVDTELKPSAIKGEEVVIRPSFFSQVEDEPTSTVNFSQEEIRRAPGSAGDVSRIIYGLPSIAKIADTKNNLVVRGGNPMENSFYIDNIEIPNINHYPDRGSSGGPIGLLNVDLVEDVNFYTGGFSAVYGDRLSSVMDLSFREGNRTEFDAQLDLNFAGFGGVVESPIGGGRGSWVFSARRSYVDIIVDWIEAGTVPTYSDCQGKLVYDLSDRHRITVLDVLGIDKSDLTRDEVIDTKENEYGGYDAVVNTGGVNWRYLWGGKGFSNVSLSHTYSEYDVDSYETHNLFETGTDKLLATQDGSEQEIKFRNVNYVNISSSQKLEFGVEVKHTVSSYDSYYGEYNDPLGNVTPPYRVDDEISASKLHGFFSYSWKPVDKLTNAWGVRVEHFTYNENTNVSPRMSVSYQLTDRTTLSAATGIYYQNLPLVLLSQNVSNKNLEDPTARHYVIGVSHLLTENTRLTVEVYDKEYDRLPLDPVQPSLCVIDQVLDLGFFRNQNPLVENGKATAKGIEVMVQKKLAEKVYGTISGAFFRSRYRDYDGVWRDRIYDNRYLFNIEGGYKPNNKWEFSTRWIWAGGGPFTPFDEAASEAAHRGVLDEERINEDRKPDFHSLNLRFDRRLLFKGSNLIFYLSVWNVYGRKNVEAYYWNEVDNKLDTLEGWGTIPVIGLEFEF